MSPTVSVVVTAYNEQPEHLREALASVVAQTITPYEIIVVDDGSESDVGAVVREFPGVRLIRQENQGLAAARNTGWRATTGSHVAFLDGDDRLVSEALAQNLRRFAARPDCGLVYGAYRFIDRDGKQPRAGAFCEVGDDPYATMLRGNPIGMHAAVLYRRDHLATVNGFDSRWRACEDYELYIRMAARFPILCGPEVIAEYRRHGSNMSNDLPMMRATTLAVLDHHEPPEGAPAEWRRAVAEGRDAWKRHYAGQQVFVVLEALRERRWREIAPLSVLRIVLASPLIMARVVARGIVERVRWRLQRRPVSFGGLRRTEPISREFGYDRGTPVDRRYIEGFLAEHAGDIRGRVLEIGDNAYTRAYGGDRVTHSDVLHVDPAVPGVTIIADLATGDGIPSEAFDCVVLTQTLHLLFDMARAVGTLHRILKPGGVVLLTVPGVSSIDTGEWGDAWLWSLTTVSLRRLLEMHFAPADVAVGTHGNVLTAISFLHGLPAEALRPDELAVRDRHYPVIVTGRAKK